MRAKVLTRLASYGLLALLSTYVLAPIGYMALVSLEPEYAIEGGSLLPHHWQPQNYLLMWQTVNLGRYLANSLLVSTLTGGMASILGLGAAYVVSRFRFALRGAFTLSLLATQMFPSVLILLPVYVIFASAQNLLGITIIGTYGGLVLTYMTLALPFAILMLSNYLRGIGMEVEEAALIDGASRKDILLRMILPLASPGMVVAFIFSFLFSWNDVLFASVLTTPSTRTLAVGLQSYVADNNAVLWNQLMGASLVSAVPSVVLFLLVQGYIVHGLTQGSVKG